MKRPFCPSIETIDAARREIRRATQAMEGGELSIPLGLERINALSDLVNPERMLAELEEIAEGATA